MKAITTWDEAFWRHVEKAGEDDCWNWTATRDRDGYGQLRSMRRGVSSHRVSWEIHYGPIPNTAHVLHKCDNPSCVNPKHLFLGDPKINMHDCLRKKRRIKTCIIQQEDIPAIIREYNIRSQAELKKYVIQDLATRHKVSWYTIRGIVSGENRRALA